VGVSPSSWFLASGHPASCARPSHRGLTNNQAEPATTGTGTGSGANHAEGVKTQRVNRALLRLATVSISLPATRTWWRCPAHQRQRDLGPGIRLSRRGLLLDGGSAGGEGQEFWWASLAAARQRGFVAAISGEDGQRGLAILDRPRQGRARLGNLGPVPLEIRRRALPGPLAPTIRNRTWSTGLPGIRGPTSTEAAAWATIFIPIAWWRSTADTGKLKWYFQFTPHDTHDWDANETPVLINAPFRGSMTKAFGAGHRNGFYYVLDRTTARISSRAAFFVEKMNWASGLDAKGRRSSCRIMDPTPGGVRVCPSVRGASNWMSPSYDPDTGLLYVVALEQCDIYSSSAKEPQAVERLSRHRSRADSRRAGAVLPARAGCGDGVAALGIQDARTGYDGGGGPCPQRADWSLRETTTATWWRWIPAQAKTCALLYGTHAVRLADDFPAGRPAVRDNRGGERRVYFRVVSEGKESSEACGAGFSRLQPAAGFSPPKIRNVSALRSAG